MDEKKNDEIDFNKLAEDAANEEREMMKREAETKKAEAGAKAAFDKTMKEGSPSEQNTSKAGQFSIVKSRPLLSDDKKDEEENESNELDPLRKELKDREDKKKSGFIKRTGKKIAIKLGKIAFVIADTERFVYERMKLNEKMTNEEIDADYVETYNDTKEVIDNRVGIESEYGDVINLGITIAVHLGRRAYRYFTKGKKRQKYEEIGVNESSSEEQESGEAGEEDLPPRGLSPVEEAQWYLRHGQERGIQP